MWEVNFLFSLFLLSLSLSVLHAFKYPSRQSWQHRQSILSFSSSFRRLQYSPLISLRNSKEDGQSDESQSYATPADELRDILRGTCVMFVGMMGSGKTAVGDAFARKMGYRFLDTDEIAEHMIGMPIADYFAQGKEEEFRKLEYEILMELAQYTRISIATGGGIVMKQENWGLLRHGIVVYLDLDTATIVNRLRSDPEQLEKRPLLKETDPEAKLEELLAQRREKYSMADVRVTVPPTFSKDEVADLVIQSIVREIKNNPPLWSSWKEERDKRALEMASVVCMHARMHSYLDDEMLL